MKSLLKKTHFLLYAYLLTITGTVYSQEKKKDSLWDVWKNEKLELTSRVPAVLDYISDYMYSTPSKALELSKKTLEFSKVLKDTTHIANSYSLIARSHFFLGDLEKSYSNLETSSNLYEAINSVENVLINKRNIVGLFQGSPHLNKEKELKLFSDMDSIATVNKLWDQVASINVIKARRLEEWGNYIDAIKELGRVELLLSNTDVVLKEADLMNIYSSLGAVYKSIEKYTKSKQNFEKAAQLALKLERSSRYTVWLATIAEIQLIEHDTIAAIEMLKQSFKPFTVYDENNYDMFKAIEQSKASYYYFSGNEKKALYHLNRQLKKSLEANDLRFAASTYITLSNIIYKKEDYLKAIQTNKKGLEIAKKLGFIDLEREYLFNLYKCYNKLGNYKESLSCLVKSNNIKDSLYNKQKIKTLAIQEAENDFALERQETTFKHKTELQNETLRRKNILNGSLVILTLLILSFLTYINYRKRKTAQHKLQLHDNFTQKMLQNIEDERYRIAGDLHDSICHELLHLKQKAKIKKSIEEEEFAKVIEKVRRISHNLSPVMFNQVGLVKCIEELCRNIMEVNPLKINTQLNFNKSFDNRQELQIYRIIEEALNNILKHSKATHALIKITNEESNLKVIIKDNGIGLEKNTFEKGKLNFGLTNIEKRAKAIKGTVSFNSNHKGTELNLKITA